MSDCKCTNVKLYDDGEWQCMLCGQRFIKVRVGKVVDEEINAEKHYELFTADYNKNCPKSFCAPGWNHLDSRQKKAWIEKVGTKPISESPFFVDDDGS